MPPKRDTKKKKLPEIPWAEDDNRLTWSLLTEIEKPANYKVLFGKKDKDEVSPISVTFKPSSDGFSQNTSGETKVTVHKHIGQVVLPDLFTLDPNVVADHVKGKLES
jgi:hypothetical protein